jgi:hypothetical protein
VSTGVNDDYENHTRYPLRLSTPLPPKLEVLRRRTASA